MKDINKDINALDEGAPNDVHAALSAGYTLGVSDIDVKSLKDGDGNIPFMVSREGLTLTSVEKMGAAPARMRGTVACETPDGFNAYVNRYKNLTDTMVFVSFASASLTAVIDYHSQEGPAPGEHRAIVKAKHTPEFQRWLEINRRAMDQTAFATFLEDNLADVASPDGGLLLEIARKFQVKKDVEFKSSVNTTNGEVQLLYNENINNGGSTAGHVSIPEKFILGIKPYEGNQTTRVDVRFRYRLLDGGKLSVWIEIVKLEDLLIASFREVVDAIKVNVSDVPFIEGTAPTAEQMWGGR